LSIFNDSLKCTCNYCVDGSILHFEFPKVVLARISGEVGTLCSFVTCLFRDMPTNLIEIGSYLTDRAKDILARFFY